MKQANNNVNDNDIDFTAERIALNYELSISNGKMNGTRYPTTTKGIGRNKKSPNSNKSK